MTMPGNYFSMYVYTSCARHVDGEWGVFALCLLVLKFKANVIMILSVVLR